MFIVLMPQGQHDFLKGWAPVRSPQSEAEVHEIENECLGMAVLAISHYTISGQLPLAGTPGEIRYLLTLHCQRCLPKAAAWQTKCRLITESQGNKTALLSFLAFKSVL